MEKYTEKTQSGYMQLPICDKSVNTELSGDFTLPDYQPEIKRLLRVTASVLPPSKYVGDHGASLAGNIDYYVLYTGSDNALYCAPLTAEYKIEMPLDLADGGGDGYLRELSCSSEIIPDMISGRVTAPRKISIKCRLKSRVQVFGYMPLESGFDDSDGTLQVLFGRGQAMKRSYGIGDMLRVNDEMICDGREGELRVISAEGKVLVNETALSGGSVFCRGDVYLKLLLCNEESTVPYAALRKIPFSGSVAADGAATGASACAKGTVSELSITVEEGRIGIDAGILLEAEVCNTEEIEYVKDVYSVSRAADNVYKDITVLLGGTGFGGNFTLSDSLGLDEVGIAAGSRVIDVSGVAQTDSCECEEDRCTVSGRVRFSLLCEKDGEYSVSDCELPFTYRASVGGGYDSAGAAAELISARARIDGERVGIDGEIGVNGIANKVDKRRMLSQVAFGDPVEKGRGEIVVCYPAGDDSAWSVAKRYGAELSDLCEKNGISRDLAADSIDTLDGVKYLIV